MVEVLDPLNPRKDQGNLLRGIDKLFRSDLIYGARSLAGPGQQFY